MRLLDLFCGAGGAAVGYHRAGFDEIVGIDIVRQKNYPFTFIQGDALQPPVRLEDFDLIHASPPCQHFTSYRSHVKVERYKNHLPETRLLLGTRPHIIENVTSAPMRGDIELCGSMFGLDVRRHRWFELSFPALSPPCNHLTPPRLRSIKKGSPRTFLEIGSWGDPLVMQKEAMGVDWHLTVRELSEAIPPAYTEYLGRQFLDQQGT